MGESSGVLGGSKFGMQGKAGLEETSEWEAFPGPWRKTFEGAPRGGA